MIVLILPVKMEEIVQTKSMASLVAVRMDILETHVK
jgi:hypothetical protein